MRFGDRIKSVGIWFMAARKWKRDCEVLPLSPDHRKIYFRIHDAFHRTLGRFPDLVSGSEFNERIQWLKLFDQNPLEVQCSDKVAVRDFVRDRAGGEHLLSIYQVADRFEDIDFAALPRSFVLKTNCDSGSVLLVRDKSKLDLANARDMVARSFNRKAYGRRNGQWGYQHIPRRVFAEQMIDPEGGGYPADYKFHCCDGRVKFAHYLYDRSVALREQIITRAGEPTDSRLAGHCLPGNAFVKPPEWDELISVAERLSAGFKYVRVDLYVWNGRVYFGELTFWPYSGLYSGEGQKQLGRFLDFDRSTYLAPFAPRVP